LTKGEEGWGGIEEEREKRVLVTDPSRTVITHIWSLFPLISNCISVPSVHHCPVDYCSNVRWSCEYLCCVVLAFVPCVLRRWLRVSPRVVSSCVCVFIRGNPHSVVWVSTLCFVYMFVWSSSPCLYMARCNVGP
jgi:hypothetical protein